MFCRQYNEAIQELADGTLGPVRRAELQTHLDQCADCRALAADLQKIKAAASTMTPVRPPDQVWQRITAQLEKEGRLVVAPPARTRYPAMLAIAASLVIAIGGALFMLRGIGPAQDARPAQQAGLETSAAGGGNAADVDPVQSINEDLTAVVQHYESAIGKLEQAVNSGDGTIDPQVAAVLQKNLPVIDQAITETQSALKSEPQNAVARESLFDALRKKVNLLQDTLALMNEMRKGNSAGAAQIVDGASKS
jgi:anti-sigma factor RsiW